MTITLYIGSLGGGGAERITCEMSNYLVESGHTVKILVNSDVKVGYELDDRVEVIVALKTDDRVNFVINQIKRFWNLYYFFRNDRSDCCICMSTEAAIYLSFIRKIIRYPLIMSERANPCSYSRVIKSCIPRMCKIISGFVFQTEEAQNWYARYIRNQKYTVIPNAVNKAVLEYIYIGERDNRIVSIGRLSKEKNFQLLISAFSRVHKAHPEYELTIYGEGVERKNLENLVEELKLNNCIKLPGFKNPIAKEVANAQMFVLTSNFEGMPNALIEAMSLGLACVSTNCPIGGPRFLIKSGINGYLFPVGDEEKLVELLELLICNKSKRDYIGDNAKTISEKLSSERIYKQWEDFIRSVIEK